MDIFQTVVLSIVEGLTEYLPISSTAHMKITNPLIGVNPNDPFADMFEVIIQLAAILSVVTIYWKKFFDPKKLDLYVKLVIAVIPALVFGALLKKHIDSALSNLWFISGVMVVGGIILLFVDNWFTKPEIENVDDVSNMKALTIGGFQVLSILFPGLSRSASTIIGGMSQKLSRNVAAEFSFFLAVPTMIAASAKSFLDVMKEHKEVLGKENLTTLAIGGVIAYIVALLAVRFFIGYLQKHGFKVFGWYRIALGIIVMGLLAAKVI